MTERSGWRRRAAALLGVALLLAAQPAAAWHQRGHEAIARQAVHLLPDDMPGFFRAGAGQVAHGAMDADLFKHPGLGQLTRHEAPEHYINLERLQGRALPGDRHELLEWMREHELEPAQVGMLPYAIVEWTQRLAVAFAEHRRWPDNPYVQARALVYAGLLAHYSGDLVMPLHTTVHYNGRPRPGASSRGNLHARVDALLDRLPLDDPDLLAGLQARAYGDLPAAVGRELSISHAEADRVHALAPFIPALDATRIDSAEVRALAAERYRHGVAFTASLFLTAWELSGRLSLPSWRSEDR